MRKTSQWVRTLAVLTLLVMLLTACGTSASPSATAEPTQAAATAAPADTSGDDDATDGDETPDEPAAQELVKIEFMNMNQSWTPVVFGDDPVTKVFMEKTGVEMICSAPQGDPDQIANVMLVSDDYPEMMHMNVNATYNKYASGGALLAIDDLAAEYGYPDLVNGNHIPQEVVDIRRSADGKLYICPNWFSDDGFGSVGTAVNVRNDIYTELGSPELSTIDDLYDYLQDIKAQNLTTADGLTVYPLAYNHTDKQYIGYIANLWGSNIYRFSYYNEDTNKVEFFLRNPDVTEAIKFLSKCLADGLLDPEVLTQDSTQRTEANNTGKYAVILCEFWDLWTPNSALSQVNPDVYYKAVSPPAGSDETAYFGRYHTIGGSGTMITKNCQNPDAAIRFCDYFLSAEGNILNFYGVEGETMEYVDGKPQLYDWAYEAKLADWNGAALQYGIRVFDMMNNAKYNWERDQESEDRQIDRKMATDHAFNGSILQAIIIDPATEEGILYAEIEANIISELTKLILEPDPAKIESMMQELLAEYERRGIDSLETLMTDFYLTKI